MNPIFRFFTPMFKVLFLNLGICLVLSSSAFAIFDLNENGVSDYWEKQYNSGNLYSNFNPAADPDGDGWNNAQEAEAGTDPGEANPPTGYIRPEIEHIPAVYLSPEENGGEPTLASPEAIRIRWPTLVGKTYTLLTSVDLSAQSWIPYGGPRIGTGSILGADIPLSQPDGSIPPAAFLRVAVEDIDIDGDTLTNAEEHAVGSSSYFADTNGDGILDEREIRFGNNPSANTADENGDGIPDNIFYSVEFEMSNEHHSIPTSIGHLALSGIDNLHRYLTYKSSAEYSISGSPSYPDLANGSEVWTSTYLVEGVIPADGQGITKLNGISLFEWRNTHYLPLATDEYLDDDPTQTVVTGPTITATEFVETTTETTTWRVKKYVAGNPEDITVRSGTETVIITDRRKLSDSVTYQELWNNYFKEIQWPASDASQFYLCGPHNGMNQARSTFGDVVTAGYIRDAFRQEDFTIFGNISYCGTSQGDYGFDARMKSLRWRWIRFNPLTPFDYEYAAPPASYQKDFQFLVSQINHTHNRTGDPQNLDAISTKGLVEIECKGSEGAGWHTVDPSKFDAYQIEEPASLATLDFTKCGTSRVHFGNFPVDLNISHPAVESDHPPYYTSDADLPEVRVTFSISPAADGTIIEWDIVEGDGSLSERETTTTNGFASTVLTTSTNAGDTYKVRGRVKTLLLPLAGGQTEEIAQGRLPALEKETATITVLAGFASSITVEKQTSGAPAGTSLIADGKSEMTLIATILDQYGQPVEENTPVVWHMGGLGKIVPLAEGTDGDGKIRAKLIAGTAVGQQRVRIEASGFEVTEVIENETAGAGLSAGSSSLDIATHQTTTLTASFPGVADGVEVKWFSSKGEIINATTTVQSGQATSTLRAGSGRIGTALVTASVGSSLLSTQVEMITSAPISVSVANPVIVGDQRADGTTTVESLDGSMQSVFYHTGTAVKIKASGFGGMPATVSFGSVNPNVVASYRFEQITGNQVTNEINANSAAVTGAILDANRKHEGTGSLAFDGDDYITIPDSQDVRARLGFSIGCWLRSSQTAGSIIVKNGEYRLFVDALGKVSFGVTTSVGEQLVVGSDLPVGSWCHVQAELSATGDLSISIDGVKSALQTTGTVLQGSSPVVAGSGMVGWLDLLAFAHGKSFVAGPGLNVTGLSNGQVVLDANGEATLNIDSIGQALVNEDNPVATIALTVSINPSLVVEDAVQVATSKAYAVLDATMGDVKITTSSQTSGMSDGIRNEVVAKNLMEFERTGQRSSAIPFEPTGNVTERRQYGFRATLWLEETVDGASQVKLVMENVDRLNLTPEQKAHLPEQMNSLLMEAIKGSSDESAQEVLAKKHGGILETLALLSEQDSFRAFTLLIDGEEIFFDLGKTHELLGSQIVKDIAKLAKDQEEDPTFGQRILSVVQTFTDIVTGEFQERIFTTANDFMLVQVNAAVAAGKLTASQGFDVGFGWGLFEQAQALNSMTNPFANQRMGEQMAATVVAAIQGSQQARDALAEAIPFYGLKCMDDAANALSAQGKYFEAGKRSSEFTTASIGTAVGVGQAVKASVCLFRAAKMAAKVKPRVQRVAASFGTAPEGTHYRTIFFDENQKLKPKMGDIEVHHAVDQRSLDLYGDLLSKSEMDSLQNLRGIEKGLIDVETQKPLHQSTIQKHWNRFHKEHLINGTVPNKQQLLDFATHIDDLYGHLFTPPVR